MSIPVSALDIRHDQLVPFEAVQSTQLSQRKHLVVPGAPSQSRALRPSLQLPESKLEVRCPSKSVSPTSEQATSLNNAIPASEPPTNRSTPVISRISSPLQPRSGSEDSLQWLQHSTYDSAYLDFVCERRCLAGSQAGVSSYPALSNKINEEWRRLSPGDLAYYRTRATHIHSLNFGDVNSDEPIRSLHTQTMRRAFWEFHCEKQMWFIRNRIQNYTVDSSESREMLLTFVCKAWCTGGHQLQIRYRDMVMPELAKSPIKFPPPAFLTAPAQSMSRQQANPQGDRLSVTPSDSISDANSRSPSRVVEVPKAPESPFQVPASEPHHLPNVHIPHMFTDASPETLEHGVEKGLEILARLKDAFSIQVDSKSQESAQWLSSIESVQKQAARTKTIVGVVGNTGAGKSSVINAMLDEERLVPTNCMRACTAVVTEISYNYGEDPYVAEIEFIAAVDWQKELKILFKDLLDANGNVSRECTDESSEAGIAYAKIKAVYPKMTKEDMAGSSVDALMKHRNVANILGTSKKLTEENPSSFYRRLQFYVDSKEKSTGDKRKERKPREMEFWPLIKVVRLYVKAPALSTGAVVVDLPGVHDSNQARAAVAEGYMKSCSGLWIVAPITRAVDDKAAKSLLGDSFKRQLKMDGGFSSVTFICSKTDDISITEAAESLGLEDELGPLWEEYDGLEQKIKNHKRRIQELKDDAEDAIAALDAAEDDLEHWEGLQEKCSAGETVYAPRNSSKKRKRSVESLNQRRKKRKSSADSDDEFIDGTSDEDHESDYDSDAGSEEGPEPLTEEQISEKIDEFKALRKEGRRAKSKLHEEMKPFREEVNQLERQLANVDANIKRRCISGRNEYSKGAIQQDFAAGVKELDQEIAEEEDAANFNPEADKRDYDKVANSLPVFCVSSRAYQRLQGRFAKDSRVPGFTSLEETEVPQLQAHCKKLTETGRQAACGIFLNSLSSLVNSLRLWSSNDGSGAHLSNDQKAREGRLLDDKLRKLDTALQSSVKSIVKSLHNELADTVFDQFASAVSKATDEANKTADHWGWKVNRENRAEGGYYWSTYKAICRRQGVYTNAQGPHDWNDQLSEPMLTRLMNPWDKCFNRSIPNVLRNMPNSIGDVLSTFHKDIETRAMRNGTSPAALQMLSHQLHNYKSAFRDLSNGVKSKILEESKEINRQFIPVVANAMHDAYEDCELERGPGSFMRMKALMLQHVSGARHEMFSQSCETVKTALKKLIEGLEARMQAEVHETSRHIRRDYTSALLGQQIMTGQQLPKEAKTLRRTVNETVEGAEDVFKRVVGLDTEGDEQQKERIKADEDDEMEGIKSETDRQADNDVEMGNIKNEADNHTDTMRAVNSAPYSAEGLIDDASNVDNSNEEQCQSPADCAALKHSDSQADDSAAQQAPMIEQPKSEAHTNQRDGPSSPNPNFGQSPEADWPSPSSPTFDIFQDAPEKSPRASDNTQTPVKEPLAKEPLPLSSSPAFATPKSATKRKRAESADKENSPFSATAGAHDEIGSSEVFC
ncbi:MAG: hypothetical protein Q9227_001087 [Pyrenula ochraceoflavens]